uniref:basic proline-rich protein-like n=1 Tax=Odobenus rosmarus divergens TaxID=9708 RepID=UPI00063CC05E|nr:PREDICTED: basic proline-rich protein-like [Odobenus rosmarus divergens]
MTTRKGRSPPQLRAARRRPPLPSCPSPPGGEAHPLLNPRQGHPQPRINPRARGAGHNRTPSSPPPGAPRKNEALARAKRASLEASPSSLRRHGGPRATSRLPHSPATAATVTTPSPEPGSPQRHIPGDSRSVTRPTRRTAARGSRGGKGAAEGGAAARSRSPRPDTKRPARPAPPVPTRPAGQREPPGCDPTSPHSPAAPASAFPLALAAAAKAKAGGGAREKPGSARGHSPGRPGAARVPPELSEADRGRQRRRRAGRRRVRWEGANGGRGSHTSAQASARSGSPPSGSGAAPRLLAAFLAEGGRQAANGDPAGGLAARPTHLRAARPGPRCGFCAALTAPPRSALPARWRALPRTPPHTPTHPHPPWSRGSAAARVVGAPPVHATRLPPSAAFQRNAIP